MNALLKYFTLEQPIKVLGPNAAGTHTRIEVLVTPFGSKVKKDFHGEFFNEASYFGDDVIQTKFALYEHFMNDWNNPVMAEMGKQKQIMGAAKFLRKDDAGRWFEMEIKRSLEYHDAVMNMIDLKIMGASTQCFPNSKVVDNEGYISMWVENEVSLTPTPANKDTIGKVYEIIGAKAASYHLPKLQYVKDGQLFDLEATTDLTNPAAPPIPAFALEVPNDLAAEIQSILGDTEPEEKTPEPGAELLGDLPEEMQKSIRSIISTEVKAQMSVFIELWGADIEEAKQAIMTMMGNGKSSATGVEELKDRMSKMETGLLTFAKFFKDISRKGMMDQNSDREQELLNQGDKNPPVATVSKFKSKVPDGLRVVNK